MTGHQIFCVAKYLGSLCNPYNFQYHFRPNQIMSRSGHFDLKVHHKPAHSIQNPYFRLFPVPNSTCLSTSRNYKHSQPHRVTRFLRTFDYDCRTFNNASTLNISTSKSRICLIFLVELTVRELYILDFLQNFINCFLSLWKMCAIQPTRRDLMKCYKCSRFAYVHT